MKKIDPVILKGTRDFLPNDMAKRNSVMNRMREIFEKFGYGNIETPILCAAETLLGKYGEEGDKLTYSFDDAGGRRIALPYDLTVPFSRLVAANYDKLPMPFKRYAMQRVWRAEKPQKGRLREFYQCDIDIIGTKSLLAEAEIAKVTVEIFQGLGFQNFQMKVNSRRLMNDILNSFGVEEVKKTNVIRIIDRLAKIGFAEVKKQLVEVGVNDAEGLLGTLVPAENNRLTLQKLAQYDLVEIEQFLKYCSNFSIPEKYIKFDPTLARGLDYYTGIIYEVMDGDSDFGSIAGGGRYDNLCKLFSDEELSGVGIAFGFERIMLALEAKQALAKIGLNTTVLVTIFDESTIANSVEIYNKLTAAGISSDLYLEAAKLKKQFKYADKKQIPFVVVCGPEELARGEVTIKSMKNAKQKSIPVNQLTNYIANYYEE